MSTVDSGASLADRESSLDLIKLDISRTFPSLFIFQKVCVGENLQTAVVWFKPLIKLWPCSLLSVRTPCFLPLSQGGPYHDLLHSVLGAYTCYRPDVGYVSEILGGNGNDVAAEIVYTFKQGV